MPKKWMQVIEHAVKKIEDNQVELGLTVLQKVQQHGKDLPEVMLYLADVWYQLGHVDKAGSLLEDILAKPGISADLRHECQLLQAEIALDEADFERAQTLLYGLKDEGFDDSQLFLLLADLYAAQGLEDVSVKYLEEALRREPDNQEIATALIDLYVTVGRSKEAVPLLEQMEDPPLSAILSRGRMLAQSGDFETAYQWYQSALAKGKSTSTELLFACGMVAFHLGKWEEALHYIETLLALDEEYLSAYPLLADIYLSGGKTEKAIGALKEYVSLSGLDIQPVKKLVALLTQAGRYSEAKEYQKMVDEWEEQEENGSWP